MDKRIIVSLDNVETLDAITIAKRVTGRVWGFKIRKHIIELGTTAIRLFKDFGKVMVDFKLYDIPSAMDEAVNIFIEAGADIVTVHCTADWKPIYLDRIAGVTILSSKTDIECRKYYRDGIKNIVNTMVHEADSNGYGYIVCSPMELPLMNNITCKKICPGIRPKNYTKKDDQNRTMDAAQAIKEGADLLVIGRPITESGNVVSTVDAINESIEEYV